MRQRRRRSAAVTLVLAGTISGCGETQPQRDVYQSLADCRRDWGADKQCEPVRDNRYAPSYYYGPHYYGSSWPDDRPRASRNAMDAIRVEAPHTTPGVARASVSASSASATRGGFGSLGRFFSVGS